MKHKGILKCNRQLLLLCHHVMVLEKQILLMIWKSFLPMKSTQYWKTTSKWIKLLYSKKFITMRDKGLEKLITFIVPLYIAKRKTQSIKLVVHNFHQKQILHISNNHHHDTLNEVFELLKSLSHQIILSHIKPTTFLRKNNHFTPRYLKH